MDRLQEFKRIFFSIYSYAIIYSLFGVLSTSYHACFNSGLSTLEKRYHFSSSTGGLIMITDNVATILTNIFIGYYGKTAHKPRWMAIGCVVTGLSVMVTSFPYFIYGPAKEYDLEIARNVTLRTKHGDQMCLSEPQHEDCSQVTSDKTMTIVAVTCFAVSNFFRGFGTSIYFTYGTPYLDDNVSKAAMPTFFACIFAARIMGAPIGYYMSSLALKIYENPFSVPDNMNNSDPRWIGAWWIGFLVSGSLMLLLAIPLVFFPREFKKPEKNQQHQLVEAVKPDEKASIQIKPDLLGAQKGGQDPEEANKNVDMSLKNLPGEVYAVVSNPLVMCQMMGNLFRGIGIQGYLVFQAKYLESQFRQSSSRASVISGTTGFMPKVGGMLFGGILISYFRPRARVLTTAIFLLELSSVYTLFSASRIAAPKYDYPDTYLTSNNQLELINDCNRNCFCDLASYQPVCDVKNMKAYFSPCHAGCNVSKSLDGDRKLFSHCECLPKMANPVIEKCPESDAIYIFALIMGFGGMFAGASRPGNMVTFFRSITPEQKSLAVAVGSFWHSLFVSIPYPIIFGKIFDNSCLVWNRGCKKVGNCWLYDQDKLRTDFHGVAITCVALGSIFDLIMIYLSPRLGDLYDVEEEKASFKNKLKFWKKKEARKERTKYDDSEQSEDKALASPVITKL